MCSIKLSEGVCKACGKTTDNAQVITPMKIVYCCKGSLECKEKVLKDG